MIKSLLLLEWKKFKSNAVFRVLTFMFVVLMPLVILSVKDLFKDMPPPLPSSKEFYEFPNVWDYQGYIGSWLVSLLLGFLAIYMTSSELSQKTLRQNIITGMKRKNLFLGKILFLVTIAGVASLIYGVSSVVIGMIHTDGYDFSLIFDNNNALLRYFLMCLGYLSLAMLFVLIFKKGILAIIVYLLYMIIIEPVFMALYVYQFKDSGRNFFPINSFEDLMPFPLYRMPDYFINKEWDFSILLTYNQAIGMTLLYTTIFTLASYLIFMKRDI